MPPDKYKVEILRRESDRSCFSLVKFHRRGTLRNGHENSISTCACLVNALTGMVRQSTNEPRNGKRTPMTSALFCVAASQS